jgi:phenylacetate-CoA ligase
MLHSRLPHIVWPALPGPFHAQVVALLHQFEVTQWWTAEALQARQFDQLAALLAHFAHTSPFMQARLQAYEARFDPRLTPETYRLVPQLTRADMRAAGPALFNQNLPPGHMELRESSSSGSSGAPVTVRKTEVNEIFHEALGLRNHVWHERDFSLSFASIRRFNEGVSMPPAGSVTAGWVGGMRTGPAPSLNSAFSTLHQQIAWLRRVRPHYLFSYPSLLAGLALACEREGVVLDRLQGLMSFGEVTTPPQRAAIRRVFGHTLRDTYTASEVSTIALQCPDHEDSYHVMSESVLVEIVDAAGRPCGVGEPGRVLVTDLHNVVTPLLRYEIGDIAEWGPPCPCGRGLPVLRRIVGRTLNLLRLPDGDALIPDIERQDFQAIGPIREVQVVQHAFDRMEVRIAADRALTQAELEAVGAAVGHGLHNRPFQMEFVVVDEITRPSSAKFEAFICLIDARPSED